MGNRPGHGWTVALRRQPARIAKGRPAGGYTDVLEIICPECGNDPGRDYREVAPKLQLVRGAYPITNGAGACEKHLELHQQPGTACRRQ